MSPTPIQGGKGSRKQGQFYPSNLCLNSEKAVGRKKKRQVWAERQSNFLPAVYKPGIFHPRHLHWEGRNHNPPKKEILHSAAQECLFSPHLLSKGKPGEEVATNGTWECLSAAAILAQFGLLTLEPIRAGGGTHSLGFCLQLAHVLWPPWGTDGPKDGLIDANTLLKRKPPTHHLY